MPRSEGPVGTPPARDRSREVIVVTGEGSVELRPSHAIFDVGLECRAASPGEALAAVAARAEAVLAAARAAGLADEQLQTRGLFVAPHFDSHGGRVVEYWSSYTLELVVQEVGRAPSVVDAVTAEAGDALRLGGFRLECPLGTGARAAAGVAAVADARGRAERLADAAGVGLGRVLEIVEDPAPAPPFRHGPVRFSAAAMAPPVEEGSERVVARVRVTFAIHD